jgi:hypothetical protein
VVSFHNLSRDVRGKFFKAKGLRQIPQKKGVRGLEAKAKAPRRRSPLSVFFYFQYSGVTRVKETFFFWGKCFGMKEMRGEVEENRLTSFPQVG